MNPSRHQVSRTTPSTRRISARSMKESRRGDAAFLAASRRSSSARSCRLPVVVDDLDPLRAPPCCRSPASDHAVRKRSRRPRSTGRRGSGSRTGRLKSLDDVFGFLVLRASTPLGRPAEALARCSRDRSAARSTDDVALVSKHGTTGRSTGGESGGGMLPAPGLRSAGAATTVAAAAPRRECVGRPAPAGATGGCADAGAERTEPASTAS